MPQFTPAGFGATPPGFGATPPALDLFLKTLINSSEFSDIHNKNWTSISQNIPGTTPRQCQRRYDELLKEFAASQSEKLSSPIKPRGVTSNSESRTRPSSAKAQASKSDKDLTSVKDTRPLSGDQGPQMVIHVCDEAKKLNQDFQCPRDLLVSEMRYFCEYLSTDAARWEEVDISVHCDVHIFDWLMRFVKRGIKDAAPQLEATNVISILISSDFLKMDNLVQVCVDFCHKNMSAIVATPCNMNCINDKLVTRIADLFTHNEADEVKDKKDKFKSKLFQKKIEKLFNSKVANEDSPENASALFKCSVCKKLLTPNLSTKVDCFKSRLNIDGKGKIYFRHIKDNTFDVNEYIIELKNQLKTWREVYWRLWGSVNFLTCARCKETFPCAQLGWCRFHPEKAQFNNIGSESAVGVFPCCGQKTLRFDPTESNKGCRIRDHIVTIEEDTGSKNMASKRTEQVYNDLLAHRQFICVDFETKDNTEDGANEDFDIFSSCKVSSSSADVTQGEESKPRLLALTKSRDRYSSQNHHGDEDPAQGKNDKVIDPQAILLDAPSFITQSSRKWDSTRSLRWNQDTQRDEDQKRINDMVAYLTKLRLCPDKMDKLRQKEYAGGWFSRLEAQWKSVNMPPPKAPNTFQLRNKPRIGTITK